MYSPSSCSPLCAPLAAPTLEISVILFNKTSLGNSPPNHLHITEKDYTNKVITRVWEGDHALNASNAALRPMTTLHANIHQTVVGVYICYCDVTLEWCWRLFRVHGA